MMPKGKKEKQRHLGNVSISSVHLVHIGMYFRKNESIFCFAGSQQMPNKQFFSFLAFECFQT